MRASAWEERHYPIDPPDAVAAIQFAMEQRGLTRRDLEPLGRVVEHGDAEAIVQVTQESLQAAVARALSTLPLRDLTVEDPPLEEVMRDLFAQGRAA